MQVLLQISIWVDDENCLSLFSSQNVTYTFQNTFYLTQSYIAHYNK